jgi:hypothetical protein
MAAELQQVIIAYCLKLINMGAATWYLNPVYKVVLEPIINQLWPTLQLGFPEGLLAVLSSDGPPSIDFFLGLPAPEMRTWGVYALVFVDLDNNYHLYIGCGTGARYGVTSRTANYKDRTHHRLPRFVRLAYDRDYELLHIGMLCWAPLPGAVHVPLRRLLFLCLEAFFTAVFFACFNSIMEPIWSGFMPWTRDSVTWGPLCSHLPLSEGVGDEINLTPQQLEAMEEIRKAKIRQSISKCNRARYDREREEDLEGFLSRARSMSKRWADNNPEKVVAIRKKTRSKVKQEKRHHCDDCQIPFDSPGALAKHLKTAAHARQLAVIEGVDSPIKAGTLAARRCVDKAKKAKKFHCSVCDLSLASPAALSLHKTSKRHLKKAALAANSST